MGSGCIVGVAVSETEAFPFTALMIPTRTGNKEIILKPEKGKMSETLRDREDPFINIH